MVYCVYIFVFVLYQVICQFVMGQILFGLFSVLLELFFCGLVGWNGVGKICLLCLLVGFDFFVGGYIECVVVVVWVVQQLMFMLEIIFVMLLGYVLVFVVLFCFEQG